MNQQDKDNQRAAFEAWARKNDYLIHRSPNDERRYQRGFTQDVWEAWQAAKAHDRQQRHTAAEEVCAEAYQVVGSLLSDLGIFETDRAEKILDNLSAAMRVHDDVLPWPSFDRQQRGEPVGWEDKFREAVYDNLAAADNQDIPLEEYPDRILDVLKGIVGAHHPTVIRWRNDAIKACIATAYRYVQDPESFQYLKQDLQALITTPQPAEPDDRSDHCKIEGCAHKQAGSPVWERSADAATPDGEPSDVELRGLWYGAGGTFHGPNIETGTMPEAKLLPFLRGLIQRPVEPVSVPSDEDVYALWDQMQAQYFTLAHQLPAFARNLLAKYGQPSKPYSLDKDLAGTRALVADAIRGAIAFGAQGVNPPPEGHWLKEFWEAGKPWVPEGYALVPIEPTEEMIEVGCADYDISLRQRYKAMLEAAQTLDSPEPKDHK